VTVDGPDPIDQHVGHQLPLRRAQTGMTQTELGAKVGLSLQAVQKYETSAKTGLRESALSARTHSRRAAVVFL
jgi:transcriptional regulator with XRE-family HTH domain